MRACFAAFDPFRHVRRGLSSIGRVRSPLRAPFPASCHALLALSALLALPTASANEPRLWITGATVISPERADNGQQLDVLIEGDRIASVVKALTSGTARDAPVFNAAGMYLMPGLIDSHVHLAGVPGFSPVMEYRHPFLAREYRAQLPRSFLRYGYTTVIDLVPTDRDVLAAFVAAPAHPDLYHCGALPLRDGYPTHFAPGLVRDRVFPNSVTEPKAAGTQANARTPQAAVERVKKDGAICVKTFFERGFGRDRNLPVPSPELFAGLAKSARAAGLPVLLHATSLEAQRFGLQGGTDIFVHGMWNWADPGGGATLPAAERDALDRVASRRIGYMPTLQVIGGLRVLYDPGYFEQPAIRRVVPASLLEWYRSPAGRWFKDDMTSGSSDERLRTVFDALLARGTESTRYLAQKEAFFLFGSDTPSGPTPGNLPGLNGYLEMQRLVAAGVSLRQVLEAATLNNAKAFGLADRIGTVEPGKRANLLLLGRSPLESIEAYDTVRAVWIGGRRLEPASLEAGQ
jgi:imidazolonepropionase-like amidohydrolase